MAELQDTLARLVAASAQPTPGASNSGASTSGTRGHFPHDPFEYGVVGYVVGAAATRSQTGALPPPPPMVPLTNVDERRSRHKGPTDAIGQARLPMDLRHGRCDGTYVGEGIAQGQGVLYC